MELAIYPHSIVGWLVLFVVKYASTIHLIILEFTFVIDSILESKFTFSLFLSI